MNILTLGGIIAGFFVGSILLKVLLFTSAAFFFYHYTFRLLAAVIFEAACKITVKFYYYRAKYAKDHPLSISTRRSARIPEYRFLVRV